MISKNEFKYIQSLFHKKTRNEENVFIVEGPKMVDELLKSNITIKSIYAAPGEWLKNNKHEFLKEITDIELQKLSRFDTPNQVIAIAEKIQQKNEPVYKGNITLVLDGIQDPGNLGTIIRIADWFNITQIIASQDCVDCFNPKVVQSTMGSIFRTKIWYKDLEKIFQTIDVSVYGALLDGSNLNEQDPIKEGILVIGNESKGVRKNILPYINKAITIPAYGKAESLNAAVATGIILSHLIST